ncbi:cytochrome b family protein [Brytella acorum]|uniref:hypothetical protein n=1 Tax=Brytella acorum TaxID=2959299 RepID=UPI0025AEC68A|nr:hypothetical protein [Brytella acorum]MDF3623793.1 hypothetical protein [Brytella acorum]
MTRQPDQSATRSHSRLLLRRFVRPLLYVLGLVPALWAFWLGSRNQLGPDPVRTFEHILGLWAFRFLLASLAITPLRVFLRINLISYRRMLSHASPSPKVTSRNTRHEQTPSVKD